uniref:(northern house mosquito) hypothetical protein n=1 Tax=Culex pipiens TaxID=7175 RepID=A0A8D8FLJ3_CULPI
MTPRCVPGVWLDPTVLITHRRTELAIRRSNSRTIHTNGMNLPKTVAIRPLVRMNRRRRMTRTLNPKPRLLTSPKTWNRFVTAHPRTATKLASWTLRRAIRIAICSSTRS